MMLDTMIKRWMRHLNGKWLPLRCRWARDDSGEIKAFIDVDNQMLVI